MASHDYDTKMIWADQLSSEHVLVGERGGLSAIVGECKLSSAMPGLFVAETEHGTLYLDPDIAVEVLDD
jgi:hypothetical protein